MTHREGSMNEGWKCPNCGKAHAPHVQTCPEPAQQMGIPYPVWPQPSPIDTGYWPPHLPTVTCDTTGPVEMTDMQLVNGWDGKP